MIFAKESVTAPFSAGTKSVAGTHVDAPAVRYISLAGAENAAPSAPVTVNIAAAPSAPVQPPPTTEPGAYVATGVCFSMLYCNVFVAIFAAPSKTDSVYAFDADITSRYLPSASAIVSHVMPSVPPASETTRSSSAPEPPSSVTDISTVTSVEYQPPSGKMSPSAETTVITGAAASMFICVSKEYSLRTRVAPLAAKLIYPENPSATVMPNVAVTGSVSTPEE